MFRLYGFFTQNSRKPLYVLSELGVDFDFEFVDLSTGVQRTEPFLAKNPVGKVPVLEHDGEYLFESGAICRYVANVCDSDLYPSDELERARVDQWLDFFSCHLGRSLMKPYFEANIKPRFNLGPPDDAGIEEANKLAAQDLKMLDNELSESQWLANGRLSIADLTAFAYLEQCDSIDYSLETYPNVADWYERLSSREGITKARALLSENS